jgi:chaperone BCS1
MTAHGPYWRHAALQPARPANSVILPGDQYERIEEDLRLFFARRGKYASLGIPFRRGYLLHGLPGTGKSSTLLALASRFDLHLHMLNLSNPLIDDAALMELLANVNEGSAIVMEDVDALWEQRKRKKDNESSVTFSGLLNALDGVAAGQGRVVFMTTNHLVKLDPALTRPGRVDYRLEFGPATPDQAGRLFQRFYEGHVTPELVATFAEQAADGEAVMSDLQEFLIGYFDNPEGAASEIAAYLPEARAQKAREAAGRARVAKKVKDKQTGEEQAVLDFASNVANWGIV